VADKEFRVRKGLDVTGDTTFRNFVAPSSNGTLDLGNTTHRFGNVHANNFFGNGAGLTGLSVNPGGSNTYVQYNDSAAFGGSAGLTFDEVTNNLAVSNTLIVGTATVNAVVNGTSIKVMNSTSNAVLSVPTSADWADGNKFLNANGGWHTPVAAATPGGSNTHVQYNDSGAMGGSAGLTFDEVTNNLSVANGVLVGANVLLDTGAVRVGNSTVNAVTNSTNFSVANSTIAVRVGPASVNVGSNSAVSAVDYKVGNSVANATVAQSLVTVSNSLSSVTVDPNSVVSGNSTVNVVANSTSLVVSNSTLSVVVGPATVAVGANSIVSATSYFVGNSTVNAVVNSSTIKINSNTTANVTISGANSVQQDGTYFLNANGSYTQPTAVASPGGSNTQVQYNDSGTMGGSAGFTFDETSNDVTVANTVTSVTHKSGNSTVNSTLGQTGLTVQNSTITILAGPAGLNVGANSFLDAARLFVGNSTVNAAVTSTSLTVANSTLAVSVGPAQVAVGANALHDAARFFAGDSTVNSTQNSTAFSVANSTGSGSLTPASVSVGNSTVNASFSGANSVHKAGQYFRRADDAWAVPVVSASPGGSNTHVQFNDSGVTGGSDGMTFNKVSNVLAVSNTVVVGDAFVFVDRFYVTDNDGDLFVNASAVSISNSTHFLTLRGADETESNGSFFLNGNGSYALPPDTMTPPGGTDTQVQYNSFGEFAGSAGLTFDVGSNTLASSNAVTSGLLVRVGANVLLDTGAARVGNSTVNSVQNSTSLTVSNSTLAVAVGPAQVQAGANSIVSPTSYFVGNTVANTTVAQVLVTVSNSLSSLTADPNALRTGNSTANVVANSTRIVVANSSTSSVLGPHGFFVGTTTILDGSFFAGNSTVNVTSNSSRVSVSNSTASSFIGPASVGVGSNVTLGTGSLAMGANVALSEATLFVGNSTQNSVVTISGAVYSNATLGTGTINSEIVHVGNSTVNTQIESGIVKMNGTNAPTTGGVFITRYANSTHPFISWARSMNATPGHTETLSDRNAMYQEFLASNGSGFAMIGEHACRTDGTVNATSSPGYFQWTLGTIGSLSVTTRMWLNSNGELTVLGNPNPRDGWIRVGNASSTNSVAIRSTGIEIYSRDANVTPSNGAMLFASNVAGLPRLAVSANAGTPYEVQPWMATQDFVIVDAQWNTAAVSTQGSAAAANTLALTARAIATGNAYLSTKRVGLTTAASAGSTQTLRSPQLSHWRGNAAGLGGFTAAFRIGTAAVTTGTRAFAGMKDSVTALANGALTSQTNIIGIGFDSAATEWKMISANSTASNAIALGAGFPLGNTTTMLDVVIHAPPNGGTVGYRVTNLATGNVVSGTFNQTNLPSTTTTLTWQVWINNNANTTASSMDVGHVYLETDV
jgi:hypothetical protein